MRREIVIVSAQGIVGFIEQRLRERLELAIENLKGENEVYQIASVQLGYDNGQAILVALVDFTEWLPIG